MTYYRICIWSVLCHARNRPIYIKGHCHGDFTFWGENVLKVKLKAISLRQNTPRKSRIGNLLIFSKEEQTIVSYGRFFHETLEKLENITLCFQVAAIRILAIRSQANLIIVSESWLGLESRRGRRGPVDLYPYAYSLRAGITTTHHSLESLLAG